MSFFLGPSLVYTLYPPPTHYFDSRWGFTIVIFPLAFVYIRYTHPSYTPSTLHRHKILILAGVLPLSFFHWHLHIFISYTVSHTVIYTLYFPLTHYFASRWGFTIVILPLPSVDIHLHMHLHLHSPLYRTSNPRGGPWEGPWGVSGPLGGPLGGQWAQNDHMMRIKMAQTICKAPL